MVPIGRALPGWTGYGGGLPFSSTDPILYNTVSLGAPAISLQGPGSPEPILQGLYTVLLQGSTGGGPSRVSIGQTGQLPTNSESLRFFGYDIVNLQVTFAGQLLPYAAIGTGPNYTIYGADISAYAGQTGQLLFAVPSHDEAFLDNIQFSMSPIPEPGTCALLLCGLGAVGVNRWRKQYASSKFRF
jgi:hypothetical protein